jgi:uracil-DNA glycosylase
MLLVSVVDVQSSEKRGGSPQRTKKKFIGDSSARFNRVAVPIELSRSSDTHVEIASVWDLISRLAYCSHAALLGAEKQRSLHIGSPVISETANLG